MEPVAPSQPVALAESGVRPAIACRGITKRFPGVVANDRVDFEAREGEVHALLGENGAGKSTLSNIFTGLYRADEGELEVYGRSVAFDTPRDGIDAGIGMVHQHFRLVQPFTVAENVMLGDHSDVGRSFRLHPREIEERVAELGHRYGMAVDPRARIWQLSVGEQQRVEILKALYRDARILILDEPTAVLTPQEATALFETLKGDDLRRAHRDLHLPQAARGDGRLGPRARCCATVGRSARSRRQAPPSSRSQHLMVGRELHTYRRKEEARQIGELLLNGGLAAEGDRGVEAVHDVSLTVHAGQIVGVAGVAGNGQRELAEAVTGLRPLTAGVIRVGGVPFLTGDPRGASVEAGIAHVPEDRLHTGVAPSLSISSNMVLKSYRSDELEGPFLRFRRIREWASS